MKIFLDFDDVLFDNRKFREDFRIVFLRAGISEEVFSETYASVKSGQEGMKTYDYEEHLREIRKKVDFDESALRQEVDIFVSKCDRYIFSDSLDFIRAVKHRGFEVVLISFGTSDFQEKKVNGSGIKKFLDGARVGDIHKGKEVKKLLSQEGVFWFLDDRTDHIENVKRENIHVKTVLVTRPEGRYTDTINKWCDFQVKNLDEARQIINNDASK